MGAQHEGLPFLPTAALDGGADAGLPCLYFCDGRSGWRHGVGRRAAQDVAGCGGTRSWSGRGIAAIFLKKLRCLKRADKRVSWALRPTNGANRTMSWSITIKQIVLSLIMDKIWFETSLKKGISLISFFLTI